MVPSPCPWGQAAEGRGCIRGVSLACWAVFVATGALLHPLQACWTGPLPPCRVTGACPGAALSGALTGPRAASRCRGFTRKARPAPSAASSPDPPQRGLQCPRRLSEWKWPYQRSGEHACAPLGPIREGASRGWDGAVFVRGVPAVSSSQGLPVSLPSPDF